MTTWAELDTEYQRLLGQANPQDSDARKVFFDMALRHFANDHTAQLKTANYNGDGTAVDFVLPTDLISIYSVYLEQEEMFYEPIADVPGTMWDTEPDAANSVRPYAYRVWPAGNMNLTYPPPQLTSPDSDALIVKYFAYWPEFGDSDGPLHPEWSNDALLALAVANALIPSVSDFSFLNEFRTRVDSGNPMQNPIVAAYKMMTDRYEWLLKDRPRQVRDVYFTPGGRHR